MGVIRPRIYKREVAKLEIMFQSEPKNICRPILVLALESNDV